MPSNSSFDPGFVTSFKHKCAVVVSCLLYVHTCFKVSIPPPLKCISRYSLEKRHYFITDLVSLAAIFVIRLNLTGFAALL